MRHLRRPSRSLARALGPEARQLRQAVLQWSLASSGPVNPAALTAVIGAKEASPEPLDTWTIETLEDTCGDALVPWLSGSEHLVTAMTIAQALLAALRYQIEQGLGPDSDAVTELVAATARLGLTTVARQRSSRPTG